MTFDELFADFDGFFDIGYSKVLQPAINCCKIVNLCGEFLLGDSFKDMGQVLLADRGAGPSRVFHELLAGHLLLLLGVMSISP